MIVTTKTFFHKGIEGSVEYHNGRAVFLSWAGVSAQVEAWDEEVWSAANNWISSQAVRSTHGKE